MRWLLLGELLIYAVLGCWLVARADWTPLQATGIKRDGQPAWRRPIVQYKQFDGEVDRVVGVPTRVGGAVFVWENNVPQTDGQDDLMMQKVGAFGGVGSPGN